MWEDILNLAIQNGLWAVLFLGLLIYQLKDSRTREKKYQQTIENLNRHLDIVEEIDENVQEIKGKINEKKQKVKAKA